MCGFGEACPTGGTCAETLRMGELCVRSCQTDSDCRSAEGYVCDDTWKACALPGMLSRRAPICADAGGLERKTFGGAARVSAAGGPGRYHFEPAAVIGKKGEVIAAYVTGGKTGEKNDLAIAVVSPDGKVEGDLPFKTDRENHFDPWMAVDRNGKAHLVWLGFDGGMAPEKNMQIGFSTSSNGKSWSKPISVHDGADCPSERPGCLDKPMIAIGPSKQNQKKDALYVFYYSNSAEQLRARRSLDGGSTFSSSTRVGSGAYGDVEVDEKGTIHVVYVAFAGDDESPPGLLGDERARIEYVKSSDGGGTFSEPAVVSADGEAIPFFFSNPQVISDAKKGTVAVVYPEGSSDLRWDLVIASSSDGGKTWTRAPVNDDPPCANHMTPTAARDPKTGRIHVAWTENRGGKGGIAYATCEPGGSKCGKNEGASTEPFAAYSLTRHGSKWLGEYYPILIDAERRKVHLLWTQTIDESGVPTARVFYAAGKLR